MPHRGMHDATQPLSAMCERPTPGPRRPPADEPQSFGRKLTSRLPRPVDASVRRPRDLAL